MQLLRGVGTRAGLDFGGPAALLGVVCSRRARPECPTVATAIRTAAVLDASTIAHVHVAAWQAAYRGQIPDAVLDALSAGHRTTFWQARLVQGRGEVFVAEDAADLLGFCDLIPSRDRGADARAVAEIAAIYVHPRYWRQGVGRALCAAALAEAREQGCQHVTLWVLNSNSAARCFYRAQGFHPDGATKIERMPGGSELPEVRYALSL